MKKITHLKDLMVEQLRDLYQGEKQLDELLPQMIAKAKDEHLVKALEAYYHLNEGQIMRIRQVFELLFAQKRGEICDAMIAMVKETEDLIVRCANDEVRDAALITSLQHIIHYQIAGYGAVCTYSQMLDFDQVAEIIHQNLEEEKATDEKLIRLAESQVNKLAI